jgi:hypothetical protein
MRRGRFERRHHVLSVPPAAAEATLSSPIGPGALTLWRRLVRLCGDQSVVRMGTGTTLLVLGGAGRMTCSR